MTTPAGYTLTNPQNGSLALKIQPFTDNSRFDHVQRLSYYSVILLTHGRCRLRADFAEYQLSAGTLLFFTPYQPFMLETPDDIRGVALHFHPDFFCIHQHQKEVACNGVLFNNIYQTPALPVAPAEMEALLDLIEKMKPEIVHAGLAQYEALVAYLKLFLIHASRLKLGQSAVTPEKPVDRHQSEIAQKLGDAIEEHYRTRHSAGDYAVLLHVTPKMLARISKSFYSKTVTALIAERIVIEAKRELYLTSKTVKEVAYLLGFEDEFYFSRFFKNHAGVPPLLFRETVGFARAEPSAGSILEHFEDPGAN
jgi:AraC family transcriptional regulator, transcriptional activator of pobA